MVQNLLFVNGVLWVLRSDVHWHNLPSGTASRKLCTNALPEEYRQGFGKEYLMFWTKARTINIS